MEGVPNVESFEGWHTLRDEAPARAQELIGHIEDFERMDKAAQVEALQGIFDSLALNNENRYIAREVARVQALVQEHMRHEQEVHRLTA